MPALESSVLTPSFLTDVVVAVAVRFFRACNSFTVPDAFLSQTHPSQNMIATGSIDADLSIRIWEDLSRQGQQAHASTSS